MADLSDISDVNPDEMAKMMEDMDDLDSNLFGSLKPQKTHTATEAKDPTIKSPYSKKKVAFREFDEDDPLADLLSNEEDFQEETKSSDIKTKGKLMSDLFGIKTNELTTTSNLAPSSAQPKTSLPSSEVVTAKTASRGSDWLGLIDEPFVPLSEEPRALQKPANVPNEDRETVVTLSDKPSSAGERRSKKSLMEDLFGNRPRSTPLKEIDFLKDPPKLELEVPAPRSKLESSKVEVPTKSSGPGYALSTPMTREPRRGRRNSGVINDPLGLLSSLAQPDAASQSLKSDVRKPDVISKSNTGGDTLQVNDTGLKPTQKEDLPEWLDGPKKTKDEKLQSEKSASTPVTQNEEDASNETIGNPSIPDNIRTVGQQRLITQMNMESASNYPENMSALIGTQFDQHALTMSMKQQEHELRTAVTLSQQNDQLNQILESQKARLNNQERQFNELIKRQIDRQASLEAQMRTQQQRIDGYIQALMAQPASTPVIVEYGLRKNHSEMTGEPKDKELESESLTQKLQLEKSYLETELESLKKKHEREIIMIEDSYEKQIAFLQEAMEKLEKRMRHDVDCLEGDFEMKIKKLQHEKECIEISHAQEIENLKKAHMQSIEEIVNRQRHNVQLLQKEHEETIENITKAKEVERQAIQLVTAHSADFNTVLEKAQITIDGIQDLYKKIGERDNEIENTRQNCLKKQENDLEFLREQLTRQGNGLEVERNQLTEIIKKLEIGTSKLFLETERKSVENSEVEERLKKREKLLIRDRELLEEKAQWEHNHLQSMKEAWMKEQERHAKLLAEEREAIAAEKAKLEVFNRLKVGASNTAKVELEAAIRAAQEATADANQERQTWQERINELELQKHHLKEKETQLLSRAKELEDLTQAALEKREEGLRALKEARRIEEQHKERLVQVQIQLESIAERENRIATEKVALARERLALRVSRAERPEKETTKTTTTYNNKTNDRSSYSSQVPLNSQTTTHFKDIVDPNLVLLKLNLDNKLDTSNECLATMQTISR